jgi:TPP-dependent pyruvate/acetoin dehydrogenase alpha subunit
MRDCNFNVIKGIFPAKNIAEDIFRRMCFSRYFEELVTELHKAKIITCPIYLSIGQESIPAALSTVLKGWYIFCQHRSHSTYLSFGGNPQKLLDELLGLPSGCTGGKGGSAMIQDDDIHMIGYHGLIGENLPFATGFALASNKETVCFLGDGGAEEDVAGPSFGFAATHKLPILFVCVDNDLAVLTRTEVRRNWKVVDVAKAYGLHAVDIADDPWTVAYYARNTVLPALINIKTCRDCWHVGAGESDGSPDWNRFELVKSDLLKHGIDVEKIYHEEVSRGEELWLNSLKQLKK